MSRYTVLYDANVLYPAPIRDLLMEIACADVIRARWSGRIHEEWMNALLRKRSDLSEATLEATRDLMDEAVPDALVTDFSNLEPSLKGINEKDRHVLAAAIVGRCDAIITFNLKDFPSKELDPYDIEAMSPDDFICHQHSLTPKEVLAAVDRILDRLKAPPVSMAEYTSTLAERGMPKTAKKLEEANK